MENRESTPKLANLLKLLLWAQEELDTKKVKYPKMSDLAKGDIDELKWLDIITMLWLLTIHFLTIYTGEISDKNNHCFLWIFCEFSVNKKFVWKPIIINLYSWLTFMKLYLIIYSIHMKICYANNEHDISNVQCYEVWIYNCHRKCM